jgi:hypothetical protein
LESDLHVQLASENEELEELPIEYQHNVVITPVRKSPQTFLCLLTLLQAPPQARQDA